jgi:hypothetical protein
MFDFANVQGLPNPPHLPHAWHNNGPVLVAQWACGGVILRRCYLRRRLPAFTNNLYGTTLHKNELTKSSSGGLPLHSPP